MSNTFINIILPSRQRSALIKDLINDIFANSKFKNYRVLIIIDKNDPEIESYKLLDAYKNCSIIITNNFEKQSDRYNSVVNYLKDGLIFSLGDDTKLNFRFWDEIIIKNYKLIKDNYFCLFFHCSKSLTPYPTHPIIHTDTFELLNYLFVPSNTFYHFYCDTWIAQIFSNLGRLYQIKDVIMEHETRNDPTSNKIFNNYYTLFYDKIFFILSYPKLLLDVVKIKKTIKTNLISLNPFYINNSFFSTLIDLIIFTKDMLVLFIKKRL